MLKQGEGDKARCLVTVLLIGTFCFVGEAIQGSLWISQALLYRPEASTADDDSMGKNTVMLE